MYIYMNYKLCTVFNELKFICALNIGTDNNETGFLHEATNGKCM